MKPHPRIRKTIKWGSVVLAVLFLVLMVCSGWFGVRWVPEVSYDFQLSEGRFSFWRSGNFETRGDSCGHEWIGIDPYRVRWGFESPYSWYSGFSIPLWVVIAGCLLVYGGSCVLDAMSRRRAALNLCPKCNYDRAGIAKDAVCPECGAAAA